ncbi:MAG: AmmeMemoRadiSam system protein B [bacterium]
MDTNFIVPKLREDIDIEFLKENDGDYAILIDRYGYAPQPLAIQSAFLKVLDLIDGNLNFNELLKSIKAHLKIDMKSQLLIEILKELNDRCFLESPNFYFSKYQLDYYKSIPIRPAVCEGLSYSPDTTELELELENILSAVNKKEVRQNANFIIVPHIDFSIGKISHEVYAPAYHSIRNTDADLFVIFGTSHYGNSDLFMLSEKDFQTPLGIAKTDKEILQDLKDSLRENITIDEIAHRFEHSIELQVVLLQYLFKDKDFTILPVLTGPMETFLYKKLQPNKDNGFFNFISSLNESILKRNKKPMFIASGDMAHIGRKFQDNFDAEPALTQLKIEDGELINHIINCDSEALFNKIAENNDKRKICGLAPIYALLESQKNENEKNRHKGKLLNYNQWNEVETRSAVSFASIAFY